MKFPPSIKTKYTTRIFNNKYKYKAVIISKGSSFFRGNNLDFVKESLKLNNKLSQEDQAYLLKLYTFLKKSNDYNIRVESPLLSYYTNNAVDLEKIVKLDPTRIKYISYPQPGSETILDNKKIIVKNLDYEFKVTMGATRQDYHSFLNWCEDKQLKVKLPKRAQKQLGRDRSWGGYYFYVKDEKTLTMVKMFLGGYIQSVEQLVKA